MRLRSLVCLLFILVLGVFLSGCGNNSVPTTESVASTQETLSDTSVEAIDTSTSEVTSTAPEIDPEREIVALVNGYPIYFDELESAKSAIFNQYAQTYAQFGMDFSELLVGADGRMFELGIEADAFQQLVQLALTQAEADQRGIVVTDEEVQQEFDLQYNEFLVGQGWTEEDLALYLVQQGQTVELFKENVKGYIYDQVLATEVQRAVAGPLDITQEQLSEHFIENEAEYSLAEQIRASHILVETREEAEQILAELNDGADFSELASELSIDPGSGANGGDLNWFGRGAMVAPFEEAAFALTVGQLSDIVETDYGYHVILLTDRQDASVPELADVIDQVRTDLESKLIYDRAVEWYTGVLASAVFDIRRPLLDAIINQADDIDAATEILEQAQDDGTSDDPYLPFVLGTFYAQQLTDALAEKAAAELDGTQTAEIDARIDEYRTNALAAFRLAQENVGEDPGIQSKIEDLEAQRGNVEEATP